MVSKFDAYMNAMYLGGSGPQTTLQQFVSSES